MAKKQSITQPSKTQINWMIGFALVIGASILFGFWYTKSYLNPSNVFWGTISSNLNIDYVTRTSSKSQGPQTLVQKNDLQFSPQLIARAIVNLANSETNERVITETIGTNTTDYLRYVEITSSSAGQANVSAVGVWAKRDAGEGEQSQILSESLLGSVLMFGNLNPGQRQQIVGQLETSNAFKKYDLIGKKSVDGHNVFTFNVSIDLDAYSKVYSDYLKMLGQDKLAEQIGQQQSGATYDFVLDINAGSRVPLKLSAAGSEEYENFSNVGTGPRINVPQTNLTISDLQAKLSGN